MPLSWNEIKDRALKFSHEWADESSEEAEAKSFWDAFFTVFGVPRRRVATFEQPVKKSDGHGGFIDLLWKGILLVEHKSRGKDLDRAFQQAKDYFPGLKDRDLPRYILVSDFARFRLYDLEASEQHEFTIKDFYKNIRRSIVQFCFKNMVGKIYVPMCSIVCVHQAVVTTHRKQWQ